MMYVKYGFVLRPLSCVGAALADLPNLGADQQVLTVRNVACFQVASVWPHTEMQPSAAFATGMVGSLADMDSRQGQMA
jgi:hypothetical protein